MTEEHIRSQEKKPRLRVVSLYDNDAADSLARLLDPNFYPDSDSGLRREHYKLYLCGRNRADVLATLYNASKPQGRGFQQYDPTPMTREQAQELLDRGTRFDYIKGRVMHINLSGDFLDPREYDRNNSYGAAARAIFPLIMGLGVNSPSVQATHISGTQDSARTLEGRLNAESETTRVAAGEGVDVFELGYSGVADALRPKIEKITKSE